VRAYKHARTHYVSDSKTHGIVIIKRNKKKEEEEQGAERRNRANGITDE
jgi:hypothetical protein